MLIAAWLVGPCPEESYSRVCDLSRSSHSFGRLIRKLALHAEFKNIKLVKTYLPTIPNQRAFTALLQGRLSFSASVACSFPVNLFAVLLYLVGSNGINR